MSASAPDPTDSTAPAGRASADSPAPGTGASASAADPTAGAARASADATPGIPWLILPTYNEAENIRPMIASAGAILAEASPAGHRILVVDDGSPDGTGAIADGLAAEHEWVHVLHRTEKNGIGPAYLAGFRYALDHGAGHLFEMDCDFSHDPADLARLLQAVRDGADLALGSRYVPGGGTADWGLLRRFISQGGSTYARIVLSLRLHDLTGGFKCFKREVLEAIRFDSVRSQGYAFQVELTYRAVRAGFRVVEVPIVFRDREYGTSKMSWRIATEAMWLVPLLRLGRQPPGGAPPSATPPSTTPPSTAGATGEPAEPAEGEHAAHTV
jgi:dolichol-phosphate mannosyltransferase